MVRVEKPILFSALERYGSLVFLIVYAASLITTLLPALRASRVEPAEALRYQ